MKKSRYTEEGPLKRESIRASLTVSNSEQHEALWHGSATEALLISRSSLARHALIEIFSNMRATIASGLNEPWRRLTTSAPSSDENRNSARAPCVGIALDLSLFNPTFNCVDKAVEKAVTAWRARSFRAGLPSSFSTAVLTMGHPPGMGERR